MGRHQPGDVVHETARGVRVEYRPSLGSSIRYRVRCPHGNGVNARTVADAREEVREVDSWCVECAAEAEAEKADADDVCDRLARLLYGENPTEDEFERIGLSRTGITLRVEDAARLIDRASR